MKAYVLVETMAGKTTSVKRALGKMKGGKCKVLALDAVTGPYDYIAIIESPSIDVIGKLVSESNGKIDGVTRTTTCVAVAIG